MVKLITGFKQLLSFRGPRGPRKGGEQSEVGLIKGGAVLTDGEVIVAVGKYRDVARHPLAKKAKIIETAGVAMPAFVDSHTHAVFAEPRLADFSLRTQGATYAEIKAQGGGILSSVRSLRAQSPAVMRELLVGRSKKFLECGTGTIEVKTGYGLDKASEIKTLRAVKSAAAITPLEMIPTLLAAHSIPPEFKEKPHAYLDFVLKEILPVVVREKLAVFADIFCERGYFTPEESLSYLNSCRNAGLLPKIHSEQLSNYGGSIAGANAGAVSADHVDYAELRDLRVLREAGTIATLLPVSNYFLGLHKYPNAKDFISENVPVALATDFNPGTSPCWNMQMVLSAACTHMRMTPEQALVAATINGAHALKLGDKVGSLEPGKQADIAVFAVEDYRELCYYFGANLNKLTIKKGKVAYKR